MGVDVGRLKGVLRASYKTPNVDSLFCLDFFMFNAWLKKHGWNIPSYLYLLFIVCTVVL